MRNSFFFIVSASHVRRVRVPSQSSDVDQYLDDLFMPVLDGNMDEYSDARSLAASIKGGGGRKRGGSPKEELTDFTDQLVNSIRVDDDLAIDAASLPSAIRGGGKGLKDPGKNGAGRPDSAFQPIGINIGQPPVHGTPIGMVSPSPLLMPGYGYGGTAV